MKSTKFTFAAFMLIMISLGVSDSLRGIFAPVFGSHFQLNATQIGLLVTVSYIGNLVFLMIIGNIADRFNKKPVMLMLCAGWMLAVCAFAFTDNYFILLCGMFTAMGCSTLLSTMVNLTTPLLFASSPAFFVNFLFFIQCVGTSGSQSFIGQNATSFGFWQSINTWLLPAGLLIMILLSLSAFPNTQKNAPRPAKREAGALKNKAAVPLILAFGFYFVAEHGLMNWLVTYCTSSLGVTQKNAANTLALFFGGIMLGRLIFSPLVDKIGIIKSIGIFSTLACVLYALGIAGGASTLWFLAASGIFFSVIYPTLVMSIRLFFPAGQVSGAAGTIISIASLFDIIFNVSFGRLTDYAGFSKSIYVLLAAMLLFVAVYYLLLRKCKTTDEIAEPANTN